MTKSPKTRSRSKSRDAEGEEILKEKVVEGVSEDSSKLIMIMEALVELRSDMKMVKERLDSVTETIADTKEKQDATTERISKVESNLQGEPLREETNLQGLITDVRQLKELPEKMEQLRNRLDHTVGTGSSWKELNQMKNEVKERMEDEKEKEFERTMEVREYEFEKSEGGLAGIESLKNGVSEIERKQLKKKEEADRVVSTRRFKGGKQEENHQTREDDWRGEEEVWKGEGDSDAEEQRGYFSKDLEEQQDNRNTYI